MDAEHSGYRGPGQSGYCVRPLLAAVLEKRESDFTCRLQS
jgi:hypothetical protein